MSLAHRVTIASPSSDGTSTICLVQPWSSPRCRRALLIHQSLSGGNPILGIKSDPKIDERYYVHVEPIIISYKEAGAAGSKFSMQKEFFRQAHPISSKRRQKK